MGQVQPHVTLDCVGCHYRPENCRKMMADVDWASHMTLEYEPENEYDPDAIAFRHKGITVGYIPKEKQAEARQYVGKKMAWEIINSKFRDQEMTILQWVEFGVTL